MLRIVGNVTRNVLIERAHAYSRDVYKRQTKLWTTPADRKQLLLFTAFGLLFNQFCYLSAVRLTNAGTATVLQCLQLVIIMG